MAAAYLVGAPGHVDEVLRLGTGRVRVAPLRLAGGDFGKHVGDVCGAIDWTSSGAMVATPSCSVQVVTIAAKS